MIRRFVLKSAAIRDRAMEAVGECALTEPPLEIVIQPHKSKRTLEQNALYWATLAQIADYTGHDVQELHDEMRAKFLPRRMVEVDGHKCLILQSTTCLNTKEMSEYVERVQAWGVEYGLDERQHER